MDTTKMTDEEKTIDLFNTIYKGNNEAIELSLRLSAMAHTLDDIVDKDRDVPENEIYSFASGALFELQRYQIYTQYGIAHHLLGVYLRWKDANTIEADPKRTDNDLNKTYMLRAGIYDIFVVIAYYLYGEAWAQEIGPVVRRFYSEKLKDYKREIGYAKSTSGGSSG